MDASAIKRLLSAACNGDIKHVEKFLRKVSIDSIDLQEQTALHYACANGHDELVCHLIKRGAKLECKNWCGWVPLMLAASYGHVGIVNLLLHNNANVNAENDRSVTPLVCAAGFGKTEIVQVLIDHGAEVNPPRRNNKEVYVTPLMTAAQHGYEKIVQILLQYDCKAANQCNPDTGYSPLMIAATNGHLATVKLLLEKGGADPNLINAAGQTAYALSIIRKKNDVATYLKNLTMMRVENPSIERTIFDAVKQSDLELVRKCVEERKDDVNMEDEAGATPLVYALNYSNEEIVKYLLEHGANPNAQDNQFGWTPLMRATFKQHVKIITLLLRHGADITVRNNENLTAFDIAIRVGMPEITRLLAPSTNGPYDGTEPMKGKQSLLEKFSEKFGMKQRPLPKVNRVQVQFGDVDDVNDTEELKKTDSFLSVFNSNSAMNGSTKAKIPLLTTQFLLPNDVMAPTTSPSKLSGFDLPKMPIVSTRLSNSNGSNDLSLKNSGSDSSSFQAVTQQNTNNMGKKKRPLNRSQQEVNSITVPSPTKEPDSPQSSMTSSDITSISQLEGKAKMPKHLGNLIGLKELSPMKRDMHFQQPPAFNLVPRNRDLYPQVKHKTHSTSSTILPDIGTNDLSIKSITPDIDHSADLPSFLEDLGLSHLKSNFEDEEIDIHALKELDDTELKSIGIDKTVYRSRILNAVGKNKVGPGAGRMSPLGPISPKSPMSPLSPLSPMSPPFQQMYPSRPTSRPASRPGSSASSNPRGVRKLTPLPIYPSLSKENLTVL